ncbi:MAG: RHS repeat-associated core domain-containing protein [Anaerolineaceae bacterium]
MARFISADTIVPEPGTSQGYDRYAYVNNNPINFNDPSGHRPCDDGDLDGRCDNLPGGGGTGNGGGSCGGNNNSDSGSKEIESHSKNTIVDDYIRGWQLVGTAWSIFNNPDAGWEAWGISGGYMVGWVGGHVALGIGIGGLVCAAAGPGCIGPVESALGIGNAAAAKVGQTVYRVWGENPEAIVGNGSKVWGHSWTTIDPSSMSNFRDAAGLPSGGISGANNYGRFVSVGKLINIDGVQLTHAIALDGNTGGIPGLLVPSPLTQIQLIGVFGVNPEY